MSDLTESPKETSRSSNQIEDAVVIGATNQTPADNKKEKASAKTGALWFFTIINLLVLIVICAGAYWYYLQINKTASSEDKALSSLQTEIKGLSRSQSTLRSDLNAQSSSVNNNQEALAQSLNELTSEVQEISNNNQSVAKRLAELSGRRPSDWLLAEANYLVNMAGRKVYLEKDIQTAVTLLQEADQRLTDLNDPSLFPVRALIANDIQALQQVNPTSSSSVALAIAGMLPQVSELPMDVLRLPEADTDDDVTLSDDVSDWQQNLAKTWRAIVGDFISIKSVDAPLEPYLAERQQWLIEQQIKHALAQAQTAVLNEQATLFTSAMQQAIAGIVEHYKLDDAQVGQFVDALQNIQNTDLSRNIPSQLSSQASLKDVIEQRIQNLYNNTRAPANTEATSQQGQGTQL